MEELKGMDKEQLKRYKECIENGDLSLDPNEEVRGIALQMGQIAQKNGQKNNGLSTIIRKGN